MARGPTEKIGYEDRDRPKISQHRMRPTEDRAQTSIGLGRSKFRAGQAGRLDIWPGPRQPCFNSLEEYSDWWRISRIVLNTTDDIICGSTSSMDGMGLSLTANRGRVGASVNLLRHCLFSLILGNGLRLLRPMRLCEQDNRNYSCDVGGRPYHLWQGHGQH
jgi:hypothetical protein